MAEAIDLAVANVTDGGGPFGAVVVRDDECLGRGANRVTANLDPTAHAEVMAIRDACRTLGDFSLEGATLFASCEPCPLCLASVLWARVDRVVFAASRQMAANAGFDDVVFHDMLVAPAERWRGRLEHDLHPRSADPFDAWAANASRTPY